MTLKLAQFCDDPPKYPQNLHTPQKYIIFSKTPPTKKTKLKFRILNPKKWAEPTYVISEYPPLPPGRHLDKVSRDSSAD